MRVSLDSHEPAPKMTTLHVGLASWIISDGNYPDFQAGQEATFALSFHPTLELAPDPVQSHLQHQAGAVYAVGGRVVFAVSEDHPGAWGGRGSKCRHVWVCDFGVLAYCSDFYLPNPPPPWAHVGASVTGEAYLSIDPFNQFNDAEALRKWPGLPSLVYRFRVERIWLETTPWVQEKDHEGRPSWWHRQDGPLTFRQIAATGLPDDQSSAKEWFPAHYVLECQLLGAAV